MIRSLIAAAAAALLVAPAGALAAPVPPEVVSTGKQFDLRSRLHREGTTIYLFINVTSAMEQKFARELAQLVPEGRPVSLKLIHVRALDAPVCAQYGITATPTAIVLDRFGRELARTGDTDEIGRAVGKGLRTPRIHWIDENDPRAPEVYRVPAEALKQGIPGIVKTMSLRPDVMAMFQQLSRIHFTDGFLDRKTHELIAAYVSGLNECRF